MYKFYGMQQEGGLDLNKLNGKRVNLGHFII